MEVFSKEIMDFMVKKRANLGLTQKQFAIKVFGSAKHQGWVSRIERGRPITALTVDKMCESLNLKIDIIEL